MWPQNFRLFAGNGDCFWLGTDETQAASLLTRQISTWASRHARASGSGSISEGSQFRHIIQDQWNHFSESRTGV